VIANNPSLLSVKSSNIDWFRCLSISYDSRDVTFRFLMNNTSIQNKLPFNTNILILVLKYFTTLAMWRADIFSETLGGHGGGRGRCVIVIVHAVRASPFVQNRRGREKKRNHPVPIGKYDSDGRSDENRTRRISAAETTTGNVDVDVSDLFVRRLSPLARDGLPQAPIVVGLGPSASSVQMWSGRWKLRSETGRRWRDGPTRPAHAENGHRPVCPSLPTPYRPVELKWPVGQTVTTRKYARALSRLHVCSSTVFVRSNFRERGRRMYVHCFIRNLISFKLTEQ